MDRKLIFTVLMTTLTLVIFNYFTYKDYQKQELPDNMQSGQAYRVPSKDELMRPLNREIDFLDKEESQKESLEKIETGLYTINFTNFGGNVSDLIFNKRLGKNKQPLQTIYHKEYLVDREMSDFLVALDQGTPFFYNFISKYELEDRFDIVYQAKISDGTIKKTYSVHKDKYQVDLKIDIKSKKGVRPRIFVPGPFADEVPYNTQSGFVFNKQTEGLDIVSDIQKDNAWLIPSMFGTQDKYFAHTLIDNKDNFVQRAYYKREFSGKLVSIYEGPVVEDGSFTTSFYIGPKDLGDMVAVDSRLEELLQFGWLTPLCKLFLRLLEFLYKYIGNFGLAIIALTLIIRIPMMPFSIKGAATMEKHSKFQSQIQRIRQRYKNDPAAQQAEIMRFYKEKNASPVGQFLGCLPMLIDLPVMFSLYKLLGNYMDLYQAPFIFWITDLSSKDPYYVLPVLMGMTMLWQQMLAPIKDDKQRIMMLIMPLIFMGIMANFAAGLLLYWTIRNILGVAEGYIKKLIIK